MARPIQLELPARDPRAELQSRLQKAPAEHAEAMLAAYELLQGLHDHGVIDVLRGAVGSSDQVLEIAVTAAKSPQAVQGMRNLLLLAAMLGSIEPEVLKRFTHIAPSALREVVKECQTPSLWKLMRDFLWNKDFRRGLSALNTMLKSIGGNLRGGTGCERDRTD